MPDNQEQSNDNGQQHTQDTQNAQNTHDTHNTQNTVTTRRNRPAPTWQVPDHIMEHYSNERWKYLQPPADRWAYYDWEAGFWRAINSRGEWLNIMSPAPRRGPPAAITAAAAAPADAAIALSSAIMEVDTKVEAMKVTIKKVVEWCKGKLDPLTANLAQVETNLTQVETNLTRVETDLATKLDGLQQEVDIRVGRLEPDLADVDDPTSSATDSAPSGSGIPADRLAALEKTVAEQAEMIKIMKKILKIK